jgi:hypothetical protein
MERPLPPELRRGSGTGWIALNVRAFTMPFHQPRLSARFLNLHVCIGAKSQDLLKTEDRTISAIDAFPHGMMSAHELDAIAAIWSPTPEEAPNFGLLILSAKPADASAPAGEGRAGKAHQRSS